MDKLIINVPGAPALQIELKPGVNRLGRSLNTDFQISHPSVSSTHCEIVADDGAWTVRDLGSTNGTMLDGEPVKESPWQRGQTLRLGEVEIVFTPENVRTGADGAAPVPAPPAASALRMVSANVPLPPPMPAAPATSPAPRIRVNLKPVIRRPQSFFAAIPGAFLFPFRRNGLILLVSGAVFFVMLNFLSGFAGIVSLGIAVFGGGFLFSFLKNIINTTALGDDEMPDWPEYDGWTTSGLWPFLEMLSVLLVCLGLGILYTVLASSPQGWLTLTLWIGGLVYMPMALLALAIYDNVVALNPILIIPSIFRVPLEYLVTCLVLGLLALGSLAAAGWLKDNADVPVLAPVVGEFLILYALTVIMRVAGLLYYAKKDKLNWNLSGK